MRLTRRKFWRILRAIVPGVALALAIVGIALTMFILVFGWDRFLQDFIPLDNSRIGPNLCASVTIIVLLTAYHEYKVLSRDGIMDKPVDEIIDDVVDAALHPAEMAEQNIGDEIARVLAEDEK